EPPAGEFRDALGEPARRGPETRKIRRPRCHHAPAMALVARGAALGRRRAAGGEGSEPAVQEGASMHGHVPLVCASFCPKMTTLLTSASPAAGRTEDSVKIRERRKDPIAARRCHAPVRQ